MEKRPHENLDVWKCSIDLSETVYNLTKQFPKDEQYGLILQMRRSVVSISCNIAEGAARQTKMELKQFLYMARGSLSELETQLVISNRLKYINLEKYNETMFLTERIGKMLTGFINKLK